MRLRGCARLNTTTGGTESKGSHLPFADSSHRTAFVRTEVIRQHPSRDSPVQGTYPAWRLEASDKLPGLTDAHPIAQTHPQGTFSGYVGSSLLADWLPRWCCAATRAANGSPGSVGSHEHAICCVTNVPMRLVLLAFPECVDAVRGVGKRVPVFQASDRRVPGVHGWAAVHRLSRRRPFARTHLSGTTGASHGHGRPSSSKMPATRCWNRLLISSRPRAWSPDERSR